MPEPLLHSEPGPLILQVQLFLIVDLDIGVFLIHAIDGCLPVHHDLLEQFGLVEGVEGELDLGFGAEQVAAPLVLELQFSLLWGSSKVLLPRYIGLS